VGVCERDAIERASRTAKTPLPIPPSSVVGSSACLVLPIMGMDEF
jgi:hypothetical protein